jgi:CelD/BcsL family acetyltransferase involved in cellulose biosynthesis
MIVRRVAVELHPTDRKAMLAAATEFDHQVFLPTFALSVRTCRTWEELEQSLESWNRLLRANPNSSIFQTPEWLSSWWQAFGRNRAFYGLVFADSNGETVGIAPLYADQKRFLGIRLTTLRMVGAGSGDSDALDFITFPGYESQCAQAFTQWLAWKKHWHVCQLETVPQHSPMLQSILQRAEESNWSTDSTLTPNFIVDLPPTWTQYVSSLEPSFRPLLTRYPKRLQSRFSVRYARCENVEDLQKQLQTLFDLHQMRWIGRGEAGAFASNERRSFYEQMASAFLTRGWLEFWLLELNGAAVGAQFCFRYNDTVSLLQEGFHPKYAAEKIGYALKAHLLQEIIRSGARRYDFLGGNDPYKAKFGARQKNYLNVFFAGTSRLGRLYLVVQKQKRRAKAWLKTKFSPQLVTAMRGKAAPEANGSSQ